GLVLASAEQVGRGRAPLSGGGLGFGRAQTKAVVFEQLYRYAHGTMAAAQDLSVGDDFRQPLPDGISDLLAMAKPVAGTACEEIVPAERPSAPSRDFVVHGPSPRFSNHPAGFGQPTTAGGTPRITP